MTIVKVIKLPKLYRKKEKEYPVTDLGKLEMNFDRKKIKEARRNGYINVAIIILMFALGFCSKEFLILILGGKGMGKIANLLVS